MEADDEEPQEGAAPAAGGAAAAAPQLSVVDHWLVAEMRGLQLEQQDRLIAQKAAVVEQLREDVQRQKADHHEAIKKVEERLNAYREREARGLAAALDRAEKAGGAIQKLADEASAVDGARQEGVDKLVAALRDSEQAQRAAAAAAPAPCAECELLDRSIAPLEEECAALRVQTEAAEQLASAYGQTAERVDALEQRLRQAQTERVLRLEASVKLLALAAVQEQHAALEEGVAAGWAQWEELYEAARLPPPQRQPGAACPAGAARAVLQQLSAPRAAPRAEPSPLKRKRAEADGAHAQEREDGADGTGGGS
eukprot:TRINITY_DN15308_c0_g4_i1.p1 TRINITY_DN15308_c0_g4~~TRINITY_DN15308_c0_g4_i1.p1  ORF type:complete len:311 (+),score=112.39 TRINITY_DN15308_c0_g4_i1:111-1043(+)